MQYKFFGPPKIFADLFAAGGETFFVSVSLQIECETELPAQAGVDLVTLAAMLGHSKINMVLRYAHPTEEHQFAAMEKMQRYMVK